MPFLGTSGSVLGGNSVIALWSAVPTADFGFSSFGMNAFTKIIIEGTSWGSRSHFVYWGSDEEC